jgi:hypothetical protein
MHCAKSLWIVVSSVLCKAPNTTESLMADLTIADFFTCRSPSQHCLPQGTVRHVKFKSVLFGQHLVC